jgi:dTDP-L-rhamnose 4-epimerase
LNVGTGEAVTLNEVAGHMFGALGLAPRLEVSGRYRLGDVRHAVADQSRLRDALGFTPQMTFARGIKSYVEWAALQNREEAADTAADARLAAFNLLRQGAR